MQRRRGVFIDVGNGAKSWLIRTNIRQRNSPTDKEIGSLQTSIATLLYGIVVVRWFWDRKSRGLNSV